ncbi:hypothetical protein IWX91DRAFT_333523 [Phyllosticta citricarpa]
MWLCSIPPTLFFLPLTMTRESQKCLSSRRCARSLCRKDSVIWKEIYKMRAAYTPERKAHGLACASPFPLQTLS